MTHKETFELTTDELKQAVTNYIRDRLDASCYEVSKITYFNVRQDSDDIRVFHATVAYEEEAF